MLLRTPEGRAGAYAEEWVKMLRAAPKCSWCGEDSKPINKAGQCSSCVRTKRHLEKMKRQLAAVPPGSPNHERWRREREVRVAEKMVELCKGDGEFMEDILDGNSLSAMTLETIIGETTYQIIGDRSVHQGIATFLGWAFSPAQQRLSAYLLWRPLLTRNKRYRKRMASHLLNLELADRGSTTLGDTR